MLLEAVLSPFCPRQWGTDKVGVLLDGCCRGGAGHVEEDGEAPEWKLDPSTALQSPKRLMPVLSLPLVPRTISAPPDVLTLPSPTPPSLREQSAPSTPPASPKSDKSPISLPMGAVRTNSGSLDALDWVSPRGLQSAPSMQLVANPPDWIRALSTDGSPGLVLRGLRFLSDGEVTPTPESAAVEKLRPIAREGRVQVLLDHGWVDAPPDEVKQICDQIAGGQAKFTVLSTRGMYVIDLSNPAGPIQTNARTKKVRPLRFIERDRDSPAEGTTPTNSPRIEAAEQRRFGPQSKRGDAPQHQLQVLERNAHAMACFEELAQNEERLCDEWAVFYHSYSFAALIYEVHAAVAAVLFGFPSQTAPLPRLLVSEFSQTPDAPTLLLRFNAEFATTKKDHHAEYRKVAISAMCSLVALGPEVSTPTIFVTGYSEKDLSFKGVLENLLESCYVPKPQIKKLAASVIAICQKHGLDASQFGGEGCGSGKPGHLLQIFVRRRFLDELAYAAKPFGALDVERHPISRWLNSDRRTNYGQARIVAHPKFFLSEKCVQMRVVSADPTFHHKRPQFQAELTGLLGEVLGDRVTRERTATSIYGGVLPDWWREELVKAA